MKSLTAFCFVFLICLSSNAHVLKGKVIDKNNEPIPYVQINIANTENHTHSNLQGEFELEKIEEGDTLIVSHLGFKNQEIVLINLSDILTIQLEEAVFQLDDITISPDAKAINVVTSIDMKTLPVQSSQEILRTVPGLFIGQHAGGGKAEQIFLRGFDIDHGTDINITVDGLPVNMVSHAHGQGYADLHFVIPETIEKVDFSKGAYYADKGNFTTAGYVDFQTKESLTNSSIQAEFGQFNHKRVVGLFDILNTDKQSAYIASEYVNTDGFFESPQNFHRINIFGKYTASINKNDKISLLASYFDSKWDASGQIPVRAVEQGLISRFGAIDDTEGGSTGRTNLKLDYTKFINHHAFVKNELYYSQYDFELFSNFTFFLEDSINGDQIKQNESRNIFGGSSELNMEFGKENHLLKIGGGFRNDQSFDNELSHTVNRATTLEQISFGNINETNLFSYVDAQFNFGKWLINPALRLDYFDFNYNDNLITAYETQSVEKAAINPKLNIIYQYSPTVQTFLKLGTGFHSNDTRVVVAQSGEDILPRSYGADAGFIWKPLPRLFVNAAAWYLFLEQEFVYVGDAGVVEPSGETQRTGIDFGLRYQLTDWLYAYFDVNTAKARSVNEPEGETFIPLAPSLTSSGGISVKHPSGFSGNLRYRMIGDRAANEDNSIIAEGYTIVDANVNYEYKNVVFGVSVDNMFNVEWNETQFATETRLQNEPSSVEEIHFTPGSPFFIRGKVTYNF